MRELPRVRAEQRARVLERAPPATLFEFHPGATPPEQVAAFMDGRPAATAPAGAPSLYFARGAFETIVRQSERDAELGRETMGLLAGTLYAWQGERYGLVRDAVTGGLVADAVSVRFSEGREGLTDALDALGYEYVLLGWYHSHPGYSCFLSETDVQTSTRMFNAPHHRAVVVDPVARDLRAFQVQDGRAVDTAWAVYDREATR